VKTRVALVAATLLGTLFVGAPALADEGPAFPDLPGMKLAEDATRGEVAPSAAGGQKSVASSTSHTSTTKKSSAPDLNSIRELPGTDMIPVIGDAKIGLTSSRRQAPTMPRGLAALAALGTIVSVGSFLVFRDRILGR
jgi:hypothetical protein